MVLTGKKILYIIAQQNFRDEEYIIPKKILEKEGAKVVTASITTDDAKGMLGLKIKPDIAIKDTNPNDFEMLVIAGGSGSPKLAEYPEVLNIIRKFKEKDKPIASICLAGYILAKAGILNGVKATVFPADFALTEYRRAGVDYSAEHLVIDGKIITADGPEVANEFGKEIAKLLSKL